MTTTLGLAFSARSVAKKFVLFALNITILLLGVACSILCLYQVKLMPAHYEDIIANLRASNLTDLASARSTTLAPLTLPVKSLTTDFHVSMPRSKPQVTTLKAKIKQTSKAAKSTTSQSTTTAIPKVSTKKLKLQTTKATTSSSSATFSQSTGITTNIPISEKELEQLIIAYLSRLGGGVSTVRLKPPVVPHSQHDEKSSVLSVVTTATTTPTVEAITSAAKMATRTTAEITTSVTSSTATSTVKPSPIVLIEEPMSANNIMNRSKNYTTLDMADFGSSTTTYETTKAAHLTTTLSSATFSSTTKILASQFDSTKKTADLSIANGTKNDIETSTPPSTSPTSRKVSTSATPAPPVLPLITSAYSTVAPSNQKEQQTDFIKPFNELFSAVHGKQKRSVASSTAEKLIPPYFQEIFELVQTSLYTSTAAGVLIFFSSLLGICGGIFRVNGCLKFSIGALVIVIIGEMATIGFIFFAHDKASNRSKHRNFHEDFKVLCDLADFCVNEMMLIMVGSFLCVSVVLQIGSITLSCHLMNNVHENDMDYSGNGWRKGALSRADLQMTNGMLPFANPMQMPHFAGQNMSFPYSSMPMYGMSCFQQPMFSAPGQRPVINIIS